MGASRFIRDGEIREAFQGLEHKGLLRFLHVGYAGRTRYYVFGYRDGPALPFQRMRMTPEHVRAEFLV